MDPYKARKAAKIIAIVVAIAMIVTSFSFVILVPAMFGMEGSVVYAEEARVKEGWAVDPEELEQFILYIQKNYKDEITYEELVSGAFSGVIDALGDPYSVYYKSPDESESFIESVSGEFSGVGVSLEDYHGQCRVVAPIAGTPAEKAGILSGDIIIKVDDIDVQSKSLDEIVSMMRGESGTNVSVTVKRGDKVLVFHMVRDAIKNVSVKYELLEDNIGYIQITSFDKDTHLEFKAARISLANKGARAFIIDLRNNPGGLINPAVDIANQLMPEGPITHFAQKGTIVETLYASGQVATKLPIVVLVNKGTASASEILAGAFQDSGIAKVVGTTTYGKGVAQQISTLKNGATFKLSNYYFLTPNQKKIDQVGIQPDYTIDNQENAFADVLLQEYVDFAPMNEKVKPKPGSMGLNVFGAQQRLDMIGYDVPINGMMDPATVAAVHKFQKEQGLYAYGTLDYATMSTLEKATVDYITNSKSGGDLQLEKAISLLQ
ncbi:MAG: S41 family peptidase [Anaerovoracaceae bacterium]|jgi:carboxyl-terminal processing protease